MDKWQKRSVARLLSVQALFQMDVGNCGLEETLDSFNNLCAESNYSQADEVWFKEIVDGVYTNQKTIDPILHEALRDDWPLKSLDATLRAILRAGAFELKYKKELDIKIVINEYMEIGKAFFTGNELPLLNGVLDNLAKVAKDE